MNFATAPLRCRLLVAAAAILLTGWALAGEADKPVALAATPGYDGFFRSGHFLPLAVKIENRSKPLEATLVVSSNALVIHQPVTLPSSSVQVIPFLVLPHPLHPVIEVQLVAGGKVEAFEKVHLQQPVAPGAALVAIAGGRQSEAMRFAALRKKLPEGSVICAVDRDCLPHDFRAFEAVDLLVLTDLSAEPEARYRDALTAWLRLGGRVLIIQPALDHAVSPFWRRFVPEVRFSPDSPPEFLRSGGVEPILDPAHPGLAGFRVGMGKVILSQYGQEPSTATEESRGEIAGAILKLLDLDPPPVHAANPLLAPEAYGMFGPPQWPRPLRTILSLSALGYALLMAVALKVLRAERPVAFAASVGGFVVAISAVVAAALLPDSTVALASVSTVHARPGEAVCGVTRHLAFSFATRSSTRADFVFPTKPLFYSELMFSRGPVHVWQRANAIESIVPAGYGRPTCFEQDGIVRFEGTLLARLDGDVLRVTNSLHSAARSPVMLHDAILTDGAWAVTVGELPCGPEAAARFDPAARAQLETLAWEQLAGRSPARHRVLKHWIGTHPAGGNAYLLAWSDSPVLPPVGGRFLTEQHVGTLWEIDLGPAPPPSNTPSTD